MNTSALRLLLSETLWLEPEHYEIARQHSQSSESVQGERDKSESVQWQTYLSVLAQLSCRDWLREKLPKLSISLMTLENAHTRYLDMNGFRLCIIATAHVLDETIRISQAAVETPQQAAHFYVAIEVLEEEQQAVLRGFISYSTLQASAQKVTLPTGSIYSLPLHALDAEPNHLVSYIQKLSPSAITLPSSSQTNPSAQASSITKLSNWLDQTISAGWQTIDALINPQMAIAIATRNRSESVKAGKVISLGTQPEDCTVALLVSVIPDEDEKLNVQIQVSPTSNAQVLPEALKLSLRSHAGALLQEVIARSADNYIQLRSFRGKRNARFSVDIELAEKKVSESFEL